MPVPRAASCARPRPRTKASCPDRTSGRGQPEFIGPQLDQPGRQALARPAWDHRLLRTLGLQPLDDVRGVLQPLPGRAAQHRHDGLPGFLGNGAHQRPGIHAAISKGNIFEAQVGPQLGAEIGQLPAVQSPGGHARVSLLNGNVHSISPCSRSRLQTTPVMPMPY